MLKLAPYLGHRQLGKVGDFDLLAGFGLDVFPGLLSAGISPTPAPATLSPFAAGSTDFLARGGAVVRLQFSVPAPRPPAPVLLSEVRQRFFPHAVQIGAAAAFPLRQLVGEDRSAALPLKAVYAPGPQLKGCRRPHSGEEGRRVRVGLRPPGRTVTATRTTLSSVVAGIQ